MNNVTIKGLRMQLRGKIKNGMLVRCLSLLVISFFGINFSTAYGATAVQSGNWSDSSTWGGVTPSGSEEDIAIPAGVVVTLDTNVECGEIMVNGALIVAPADLALTCDSLIVMGASALFEVGTDTSRFTNEFILTLKGDVSENFVHTMSGQSHDMGARALLALMGGTISMHGEDRIEWTVLNANVDAGSNSITVADTVDWRPGDEILLVSSTNDWNEAEELIVASVTGGGTVVNLTTNVSYWHCGTVQQYSRLSDNRSWTADLRAEVGLLTRNIVIQGASDSVSTGFGAHVMIHGPMEDGAMTHPSGEGYIKGVEIHRGGQEGILARYPFHWHLVQGAGAGQYFSDNAVHDSFNRGVTIHGTDFTTVSNNFFYNTIGHTVFLEDGVEKNNTITYNVVALSVRPAPGTETTPSDNSDDEAQNRTPAAYWITNPNNTVDFNVAAGGEGTGFWYIFPRNNRIGLSADLAYYDSAPMADSEVMGSFNGNIVHSFMNGFDIFDSVDANQAIVKNTGWNDSGDHVFANALWYANDTAIYTGTGDHGDEYPVDNLIFRDNVMVDNKFATMFASSSKVEESVFVARSGLPLNSNLRRVAHRLYDGAADFDDCYFVGWNAPLPYTSYLDEVGAAEQRVNWGHSVVETDHPGINMTMALPDFDFGDAWTSGANSFSHPRMWISVISDGDGTLTGLADSSLTANHKWFLIGDETPYAGGENVMHVPHKFARIAQPRNHRGGPEMIFTRTKSGTPSEMFFRVLGDTNDNHSFPAIVNEDFEYSVTFMGTQGYNPAEWVMEDAEPGDVAIVKFNHIGNLSGVVPSGTAYNSVAEILSPASTTTGHFLDGNGVLWFRVIADADGEESFSFDWSSGSAAYVYNGSDDLDLDGRSNDAEGGPSRDTDGDGLPDYADANNDSDSMSDLDEQFYGLDPDSAADLSYEFGSHGADGFDFEGGTVGRDNVNGAFEFYNPVGGETYIQLSEPDLVRFSGDDISTITIRFQSDTGGNLRFGWWTTDGGFYTLLGPSYTGGSGYAEHVFNVGGDPEWAGKTINRLRVFGIQGTNAVTSVDWVRAGDQGNLPPYFLIDPITAPNATVGVPVVGSLAGTAADPNGDPLIYSKVSGPDWLTIVGNGNATGTPKAGDVGLNVFLVQVDDGKGGTDTATLEITVDGNGSVALANAGFETPVQTTFTYGPFTEGWTFNSSSGIQASGWQAGAAPEGAQTAFMQGGNSLITQSVSIDAGDYEVAFWIADRTSDAGTQTVEVRFDGTLIGTYSPTNGSFAGVTTNSFTVSSSGTYVLEFAGVVSGDVTAFVDDVSIVASVSNSAPVFTNDPFNTSNATEGVNYSDTISGSATDADGDPLSYSVLSGPTWLTLTNGGALSGIPGAGDVGLNTWTVEVDDGNGGTDTATLEITVVASAPTVLLDDDFENFNTTGWNTDWKLRTDKYKSTTSSVRGSYNKNDLISPDLDTSAHSSLTVQFWYRPQNLVDSDNVILQFWNGSSYVDIEEIGLNGPNKTWIFFDQTFTSSVNPEYFRSDFKVKIEATDIFETNHKINVDDFYIEAQ
ncbi:Ig-like domain-containing protein [Pelagicoccus mobilis]|uniref:G8 domain-containing protein n=1 Tax=Pelagicoccus mobilis TaxID=415221 RepID=A0A934S0D5_9BACT|nr:G8 domain-containing protein [Pelagicoccus mobilis]MBK1880052.1 hypothetical protein [Pelagicoccus mobilis]